MPADDPALPAAVPEIPPASVPAPRAASASLAADAMGEQGVGGLVVGGPAVGDSVPGGPVVGEPVGGRQAWLAWGIGVAVYVVAVIHRTSLGVAGLAAATRFDIGASALSTFSILQVLVYAGMQIPVGLLVDRFAPRRVLCGGLLLLTAGQLGFAFATAFTPALISRAVLGCGDAMTFVSVLRLSTRWFPGRRMPFIAQLTALVGTLGNLVTTLALSQALHSAGWTATFTATALLGVGVLALVVLFLRDTPESPRRAPLFRTEVGIVTDVVGDAAGAFAATVVTGGGPAVRPALREQVAAAWREPGTRLGLWVHFTTAFPASTFLLLWGMPFLVSGQGLSRGLSGSLLSVVIVSGIGFALLFGQLLSRRPGARMPLVLIVVLSTGALWAVVLAWPGPHVPLGILLLLTVVMGSNSSASIVGLDFARPVNPPERLGTASGIVNMGGFIAAVLALFGIGLVLDRLTPGGGDDYSAHAFRYAFCVLYLPMALGLTQILRLRPKAARREAELRAGRMI